MPNTLTQSQFDVLYEAAHHHEPLACPGATISGAERQRIVENLSELGFLAAGEITPAGIEALEPYRVHSAVIMAAGMSSRFAPISYERPKGTLRVRGEVLIERQIRQLHEAGIDEILLVVGYKMEHLFYLAEEFGVEIVVNEEYATRNNNGSLWLVRDRLDNTYVCSSDNYFTLNPFESHVYRAYYSAQYVPGETKEWCIETNDEGRITGATVGGSDAWTMLGHVYFDRAFSHSFRSILERVYHDPETTAKLWEAIYIDHVNDLDMVIRAYPDGVINEFDSIDEVRDFDPAFISNLDSHIFTNIAAVLGCDVDDIGDFYPLKQGITNLSCHFSAAGKEYVYRHPGIGTEKIVDRRAEMEALKLAKRLGLDRTFIAGDPMQGWKISRFIPNARNLDVTSDEDVAQAMGLVRTLHTSGAKLRRTFEFVADGLEYERMLAEHGPITVPGYDELRAKVMRLKEFADRDGFAVVPSHNDFFHLNLLIDESGHMDLIDWEYSGMSDIANDFGTMVVCAQLEPQRANKALAAYLQRRPTPTEQVHFWSYVVFAGWCWYVWALAKEAEGDDVGEWLYIYYRHAADYIDKLLSFYENGESENFVEYVFGGFAS